MPGKILFSRVLQNRAANGTQSRPSATPAPSQPEAYIMDEHDDHLPSRGNRFDNRDHGRYENRGGEGRGGDGNKIRRGPGRRLAKEKQRIRSMDQALQQKYAALPPALQEKVNAAIEICYQQHMASVYKNPSATAHDDSHDHYEEDVEVDTDAPSF